MDDEVRSFLLEFTPSCSAALSLTMKQRDRGEKLDRIKASANFRHFVNILSQKAFQNAFRRYGRRLAALPALETSLSGRLHYHAYIQNPFDDVEILRREVSLAWRKTRWGHSEIDVSPIYSDGWLRYITKSGKFDDLDFENMQKVC